MSAKTQRKHKKSKALLQQCDLSNFRCLTGSATVRMWSLAAKTQMRRGHKACRGTTHFHTTRRPSVQTTVGCRTAGLCSYRVRGDDRSCAKHLTVESYKLTFIPIIISIPSPPHSFIPDLKPSFSANPSHRGLQNWLHGFPRLSTDTYEHICFLLFSFSVFHFLVVGSVRAVD